MDKVYIIAEAGVNHNGDFELARQLVIEAAKAGADAVKFQTFKAENLVAKEAPKADYQKKNTSKNESQFEMLKKLELDMDMHWKLKTVCQENGIVFLTSPFDLESIDLIRELNLALIKIPSGEITNYPYLVKAARSGKPVLLSTGMSWMQEVEEAVLVLKENGAEDITLLHCNTEYPTPLQDVNLMAMKTMQNVFHLPVGYSDHTVGIEIPVAAAALGASVIEKHFTLDHTMEGPDHKVSLEPKQLKAMVTAIRNIEKALGDGKKEPTDSEENNRRIVRKSIVAKTAIKKGEIFTEFNITAKRPGTGVSPMRWKDYIGSVAKRDYKPDEVIE